MKIKNWILIRGLTRSQFHWFGFEDFIKKSLSAENVICLEVPGNGYRSQETTPASMNDLIAELKKQVGTQLGPIGIIGISMGGMIAARWAELYPNEVDSIVLINSSLGFSRFYDRLSPKFYFDILKILFSRSPKKNELLTMEMTSNNEVAWQSRLQELTEFRNLHPISLKSFINQLRISGATKIIKKPAKNVLILTSVKDRLVNYNCSQQIADRWNAPIEIHSWAGHDLTLDDPGWVVQQIKNFESN